MVSRLGETLMGGSFLPLMRMFIGLLRLSSFS